jgi:hypothetical protein
MATLGRELELVDRSVVLCCKGVALRLARTNKTPMPKQSAPMIGKA